MYPSAVDFDLYDDPPSEFSRWVVPALLISVLLHVIFGMWAQGFVIERFEELNSETMKPRAFQIDIVDLEPTVIKPELARDKSRASAPAAVKLPEEKVSFDAIMGDVKATPAAPKIADRLLAEKPGVQTTTLASTVQEAELHGAQSVVSDLDAVRKELIVDNPQTSGRPLLDAGPPSDAFEASPATNIGPSAGASVPGFSNLDALLAQTGPLRPETAPIMMSADLLFDYDSVELRPAAISSMEKLGLLIRKNPQVNFTVEGHSDSFGSDQYNLELSRLRAESVKSWLVRAMAIAPSRIATRGFGESRLIAPGTGTVEEQQINRRVEILIRAPGGSH